MRNITQIISLSLLLASCAATADSPSSPPPDPVEIEAAGEKAFLRQPDTICQDGLCVKYLNNSRDFCDPSNFSLAWKGTNPVSVHKVVLEGDRCLIHSDGLNNQTSSSCPSDGSGLDCASVRLQDFLS